MASMNYSIDDLNNSNKPIIGLHLGPVVEFKLMNSLYFNSGLLYTLKGFKQEVWGLNRDSIRVFETAPIRLNGLDIPLNIAYKYSLSETSSFFLQAGPYLGYTLNGKYKFDNRSIDVKFGEKNQMRRFDYGIGIGSGVQFGSLVTSLNYEFGIADRYDTPDLMVRNRVLQLSVTYMFGINDKTDGNSKN